MEPAPEIPAHGAFSGRAKKGRFEPSQALAMSMKAGQFPNTVSFPGGDSRVLRYLKGGDYFPLEGDEGPVKGMVPGSHGGISSWLGPKVRG